MRRFPCCLGLDVRPHCFPTIPSHPPQSLTFDLISRKNANVEAQTLFTELEELRMLLINLLGKSQHLSIRLVILRFVHIAILCYSIPNPAPVFRNRAKTAIQLASMAPTFQLNRVPVGHPILPSGTLSSSSEEMWRVQIRDRLLGFVDCAVGAVDDLAMISALMNICCGILQARVQFVVPVVAALADFYQDYTNPQARYARKSLEHTLQTAMDTILKYDIGPETSLLAQCRSGRIARGRKARELEMRRRIPQPHGPGSTASGSADIKGMPAKPVFAAPPSSLSQLQTSEALSRIIAGLRSRLAKPNSNLYSGFALVARLAAELPLDDPAMDKLGELIDDSSATAPGKGLVVLWANAEYNAFILKSARSLAKDDPATMEISSNSVLDRYVKVTETIFEKMAGSEHLPSVILDLPELPESIFKTLADRTRSSRSADLFLSTLRELAVQRPPYRQQALSLLLELTNDENDFLLMKLITRFKELMAYPQLAETIIQYAKMQINQIFMDEDIIRREEEIKMAAEALASSNGVPPAGTESTNVDHPLTPMQVSTIVKRYLSLYLGLYSERRDLLIGAMDVYARLTAEEMRAGIAREIIYRVKMGGADDPIVIQLIVDHPESSSKLALELCDANGPTPTLTKAVMDAVSAGHLDGRFIASVFPGLSYENVVSNFPKLLTLPTATLKKITSTALTAAHGSAPISPDQLLFQLHNARLPNGAEALKEAAMWISMLFDDPSQALLKPDVLYPALMSIIQTQPLPILFFRTLILSISRVKAMESYALNLLRRPEIMEKHVWGDDRHRLGYINTCEKLLPASIPLVVGLPLDMFESVIKTKPTIKEAIRLHVQAGHPIPFDKQPFFKDAPAEVEPQAATSS